MAIRSTRSLVTSAQYRELQAQGLNLDLTRGKPESRQLDLSNELLTLPTDYHDSTGVDVRNYGGLQGLIELREIFGELLHVPAADLVAGNNASLEMMNTALVFSLLHGTSDSVTPWSAEPKIKFICPVPGYDRHFALLDSYGIEMISVDIRPDGPDYAAVAQLVANDPSIKGMWLVPTYSNPTGDTTSTEVAQKLVSMPTAAVDFKLFVDNAYAVHHLTDEEIPSADFLKLAATAGNPDRVFIFGSTSKITHAGSGVSFFGSSPANVAWYLKHLSATTIGPDKVNQLRHAQFFKNADGVRAQMRAHREILEPKFALVERILSEELTGLATWSRPKGGYFVNLDVPEGKAKEVVRLAKEAGIALTPAGSAFPYGIDPKDTNIRIAPSFPSMEDLEAAIRGLCVCVKTATSA